LQLHWLSWGRPSLPLCTPRPQASRTWVSGVGDDVNPCSRTAPCKTFAGAISKTAAGGEIDALDPAGYGAVTITKAITLDGGGGQVASVLVAGTNGIVVQAGASDVVILRNLRINGLLNSGNPGLNGIRFLSGAALFVDNCDIFGFNNHGLDVALGAQATVEVRNSTFRNNNGNGVNATSTSGFALVQVYNSSFAGRLTQGGVNAASNGSITVQNSNFQGLNFGGQVSSGGFLNFDTSLVSNGTSGVLANSGATANVANNGFYNVNTAFAGVGTFLSDGHNRLGNSAQGATPGTLSVK
jgi:hypothetical protein